MWLTTLTIIRSPCFEHTHTKSCCLCPCLLISEWFASLITHYYHSLYYAPSKMRKMPVHAANAFCIIYPLLAGTAFYPSSSLSFFPRRQQTGTGRSKAGREAAAGSSACADANANANANVDVHASALPVYSDSSFVARHNEAVTASLQDSRFRVRVFVFVCTRLSAISFILACCRQRALCRIHATPCSTPTHTHTLIRLSFTPCSSNPCHRAT